MKKGNESNDGENLVSTSLAFIHYTAHDPHFYRYSGDFPCVRNISCGFRFCILTPGSSVLSRYAFLEDEPSLKESRVDFIRSSFP